MAKKPFWSKAGEPPTFPKPQEGEYSTGEDTVGRAIGTPGPTNDNFINPVSGRQPRKTAFHRGAMGAAESAGARYTVSPSAKIPQNEPASGLMQDNTRMVKSRVGREGRGRGRENFEGGRGD